MIDQTEATQIEATPVEDMQGVDETREVATQLPADRVVDLNEVDLKSEPVDMAGIRVDPITGVAVAQIEHASKDFIDPGPRSLKLIPVQAFDSRKLKGTEHVTLRGNSVIVHDPDYVDGHGKVEDEDKLPKSTRDELNAGREALGNLGATRSADIPHVKQATPYGQPKVSQE